MIKKIVFNANAIHFLYSLNRCNKMFAYHNANLITSLPYSSCSHPVISIPNISSYTPVIRDPHNSTTRSPPMRPTFQFSYSLSPLSPECSASRVPSQCFRLLLHNSWATVKTLWFCYDVQFPSYALILTVWYTRIK